MSHNFIKTSRKKGKFVVFRCGTCDSECVFDAFTTNTQANQFVEKAYPKLVCIPKN